MKKLCTSLLPGILLMTLTTPGLAENRQGAVTITPFIGGYVLDKDQREESRPIMGVRGGYNFTENLGVEAMAGYSLTETKQSSGSRETDNYRYGVDILYHFMPRTNLVPFVAIGGGGTNFDTANSPSLGSHYAGLIAYGGGVKYFVAPDVALRGDLRHVLLVADTGHNNLEYSVGITFQFGGTRPAPAAITAAAEETDTTPPTVTFTSPVQGATGALVNQKAKIAFSEEMDTATINTTTFTMRQGNTPVSGTVTALASTATFTPNKDFEKGKSYTATVTTGAKDLAGNGLAQSYRWSFDTGAATDVTPPTVVFTSPVKGATAAPLNQKIRIAFSEIMDPATITPATFSVKQGSTAIAGKVSAAASTATFAPSQMLEKGLTYSATITKGARDLAGNALENNYTWNFMAFTSPKTAPIVLSKLENSHFDYNSTRISENGKTILNHNIEQLQNSPTMKLRIAGHTSAAGTPEYNQDLSERRAAAVKEYLVTTGGIDGSRLTTIGYGETSPAAFEAVPSDRFSDAALANMRVIIEVVEN
jgi:outer membrane beta-barrel protein